MPFNGGGGGVLLPHKHSILPNDGSPLDFNNTTVGSMNSGDLTYSNGAALQQLAIAAPNDQLRVSAGNIPEWFTPAAASGTFELLGYTELAGSAGSITVSFTSETGDDMTALQCYYNSSTTTSTTDITCQISTAAAFKTSSYYTQAFQPSDGAVTWHNNQAGALLQRNPNNRRQSGNFTCNCTNSAWGSGATEDPVIVGTSANTNAGLWTIGAIQNSSVTSFDGVRILTSSGSFYAGSYLAVYKINNS